MLSSVKHVTQNINHNLISHFSTYQVGRIFGRLIERGLKAEKRRKLKPSPTSPYKIRSEISLPNDGNIWNTKKMITLNKIYMDHIVRIIESGKYCDRFYELGVEVSKVMVNSSLDTLKVYWVRSHERGTNEEIAELLRISSPQIKEELIYFRGIGKAPNIIFIKDNFLQHSMEVEKILKTADFGPDYVPEYLRRETEAQNPVEEEPETIPQMRHDTLNLNHSVIKNYILRAKKSNKEILQNKPKEREVTEVRRGPLIEFDREIFEKILAKKRRLKRRLKWDSPQANAKMMENHYQSLLEDEKQTNEEVFSNQIYDESSVKFDYERFDEKDLEEYVSSDESDSEDESDEEDDVEDMSDNENEEKVNFVNNNKDKS